MRSISRADRRRRGAIVAAAIVLAVLALVGRRWVCPATGGPRAVARPDLPGGGAAPPAPPAPGWRARWGHAGVGHGDALSAALVSSAEHGDGEAQQVLGVAYLQGQPPFPRQPERAVAWLTRAATGRGAGAASAAYYLGTLYQSGDGVARDPVEAARWLGVAVELGSPHAMFLLANAYHAGIGVPRDDARALALYVRAGEREHPAALQALSLAYSVGELGLAPDRDAAHRYALEAEHAIDHASDPP
jgi:TPR repeat protein